MAEGGKAQEVGVAYVSVVPSVKGFSGELRRQMAPEVTQAGQTSASNFSDGFASNMGALKAVAASAGVAVAGAFAMESLRAFAEADQAQKALQNTLERFPALADTSIERLNTLNQAMQDKAAIDGDSLAAADAVLARFNLTGTQIERLTPLLVDYAAATGKDAASAAESLGKALLGNTRALKEIGVDFTATGNTARDLDTIMAALEARVGGQGEAFRQSAAGGLAAFNLAIEDTKESVGQALVPALQAAADLARTFSGVVPDVLKGVNTLTGAFGTLRDTLATVKLPDWMEFPPWAKWSTPDATSLIPGLGPALTLLPAATSSVDTFNGKFQALGLTVNQATGEITGSGAAMAYLQSLAPGTTLTLEQLANAASTGGGDLSGLNAAVDGSAASFTNAYGPAAAYVAMIERLGRFTLSDDAKRALDATMPSDEEKRGRAQDAAVQGRARRGDGTLTDAERTYWTDRAKAAEVARKAASDAAKKAATERARLAKEATDAARQEAEQRRQEVASFVKGVKDTITQYGAITGFRARGLFAPTAATITADMRARVAKARQFFPLIARLQKLGLNKASLLEIIQAGPVAGTEIAQALLAGGPRAIRDVNVLESQLQQSGAALGGIAANVQYGAGAAPQVSVAVYIGNEQLDGHIDTRIAANGRRQTQAANRGSRTAR